ncbi:MAG: 50S ribosomal protein L18 [Terriglobales bacterium]|jgi:large subunit ribosomal protein L18
MISRTSKNSSRQKVHVRIRRKVKGTPERPRMSVYRSLNQLYVQVIDDMRGVTLASASSRAKTGKSGGEAKPKTGGNLAAAKEVGKAIAEQAQAKGIKQVVFDRGGYQYHGRVKALADAARAAGLQF